MTFGMKASQLGYNVETAADYQLLYSSEWPLLKIEAQGTATIADMGTDQVIYTHNLGYCPMFWIFDVSGTTGGYVGNQTNARLNIGQFGSNSTHLKYFNSFADSGPRTIRYYIFRLDLDSAFTAQSINLSPSSQTIIDGYGVKIAGPGKSVSSTDYRDFTVHSSTRSPMVHSVEAKNITTPYLGVYTETWAHTLNYKPMYFVYIKSASYIPGVGYYTGMLGDGSGNQYLEFVGDYPKVTSTVNTDRVSIVMFKDQLLL